MDWVTFGRSLFTVICFVFFIAILIVAYSKRSKDRYEEAANQLFLDDDKVQETDTDKVSDGAK
ncbi:cbb3-type cytochrome oxidase subunit 3 [Paludibacterium denitrificans]|uniref:CcoQ/FixQ family Cbb3-type cytochrome c oxidase assembly chaperone n=1 Tax=Paludibacterium denitrificans TaxID=2675226 RepID=A0A844GFP5_9NEIS|nr:cbb3-type cytochrome c oxidase subunit 3 [Paludibacterium denitrificans]MTD33514.1 CcoQ/FixQ family Cbb3-type cytochrome c oxidase assembly chaperone [Paludibacterium denitrificans]HJV07034.1 cbb3-type cytochrome c oxidase subunit 3 [Chromobacteriaceae bacterium]